ncbi:transcription factor EC-like isoform X1 [Labeo rohita]|uniref:Transcription factor EC n=1 Tax=Labeo rohita TaxID=84645 RepID=A0A498ND01_LABRO|nr:transcription factor EC-like isoform X1 [Labeo rohita]
MALLSKPDKAPQTKSGQFKILKAGLLLSSLSSLISSHPRGFCQPASCQSSPGIKRHSMLSYDQRNTARDQPTADFTEKAPAANNHRVPLMGAGGILIEHMNGCHNHNTSIWNPAMFQSFSGVQPAPATNLANHQNHWAPGPSFSSQPYSYNPNSNPGPYHSSQPSTWSWTRWEVQNHLENSKYHLHQTQAQQVKQYLTLGSKLASQAHPVGHPHPGQALGTVPVMRNGHMPPVSDSSTPGSPVTLLTLANNHDSEVSLNSSMLDVYSTDQGMTAPHGGLTPSLLTKLSVKMEVTVERRRRYNINYRIKELGTLIPKSNDPDMRWNKGTILKASVEYIKWLQKEQQHARDLESRQKKLEQANRRLLLRIQELEIQARAHGLPSMAASMGAVELSSHLLKQQQQHQPVTPAPLSTQAPLQPGQPPLYPQEDMSNPEYTQRTPLPAAMIAGNAGEQTDGSNTFSDPLSHFTDFFCSTLKEEHRLDEILMDDPLSPFGTDPLLSAGSPAASKGSSRRSSFSSEEADEL